MTGTGITNDGNSDNYVAGIHVPSGRRYTAVEAATDLRVKEGPWVCAAAGCDVPLICRRFTRASSAKHQSEPRGATFACWPGLTHNSAVMHPTPRRAARTGKAGTQTVELHRVTGVPTEPVPPKQAVLDRPASKRVSPPTPYAANVSGVAGLLAVSQEMEATPELALQKQFRLSGRTYWWDQLAYGPIDNGYTRLDGVINKVFDRFGTEFYVEGVLLYRVYPTKSEDFLHLRLTSALPSAEPIVHVFMPNEPAFLDRVGTWRQGALVALFSNEVTAGWPMRGLFLQQPDQIMHR